ncbi:hypothetical protein N7532_005176, partial [Penicillium argentinense]
PSSSLQGLDCLPRPNYSPHHRQNHYPTTSWASPCLPTTASSSQSFNTFGQESDLWTQQHLSFADTDWNLVSIDHALPYPTGIDVAVNGLSYGMTPTFTSISDSVSNVPNTFTPSPLVPSPANSANSQDGFSNLSPASQNSGSVSTSRSSPAISQGDDALTRVDSSRVEKRRLNTLAARRCRQRRVDRMKSLEDELKSVRRERDELRLKVSKLEGETDALKGLLTRKSK